MRQSASALLITASAFALIAATPALAQQQTQADSVDDIVVTGTRVQNRSRLDSVAPVDVVTAETLQQRGSTELATQLAATVPALNFPRPSATDGTDSIRPATLRGQGPDQTLVLVNGVRRHATALVNTNGSVGRGSAAVDLNAIPSTAVERIEVLRDGAAAQYGSDAIAGVLNLRLRQASSGGGASVTYGGYRTDYTGYYGGGQDLKDGEALTVAGWQGFSLGSDGFLTASVEYRDRDRTNRSDIDPRFSPAQVRGGQGDPKSEDLAVYLNAGKPLANGWDAYGWVGYQTRDASAAAFYRTPTDNAQNPAYTSGRVYPNGYLPYILTDTTDWTATGGVKGQAGGFDVDINLGYGRNKIDFSVENTLNPSQGPTSPTQFYAGSLTYDQLVFGIDASRGYEVGLYGPLNVAFGLEARRESYQIGAGEPGSYQRGTFLNIGGTDLNWGSRGFTGFTPANEVDKDRNNVGVYVDLEGELVENFTASAALRYENYSDFGDNLSGKLAARYDFTPSFAVRGAISTGFRAPSLQQQYFTQTAILYINNVPYETGTFPSVSPVGVALGGTPLEAETSTNYSLGLVYRKGAFELTADAYRIDIKDRIILSETLTGSATAASGTNARAIFDLLQPYGATAARFFINGVNTETTGLDVVARYRVLSEVGSLDFTLAANVNDFDVTKTPETRSGILPTPVSLFARQATLRFEEGTPPWKTVFQTDFTRDKLGGTFRVTGYGDVLAPGATEATDLQLGVGVVVDVEARYQLTDRLTLAVGADNVLDEYPRQVLRANNTSGAFPFSNFSPYGFNGRFVYGRIALKW
ncbi:TonB-dependent siderophore receptor [Brevundimonas sp. SORGH_AS_0993]|uniref:TonB-dependent receptor plug domain-containing protein n=1 Tax=Brevundimonas sp. SORGH_AS_0993 TaxID=3041794 RepID=UPI00278B5924|nr:TonB-dependent receptor [Brevundimonas sp. SORGH_AS_0993]MDQ1153210.1 iron complex outermembrane receptor protein [Brevundimonas sp. SORGH_AS_0993]